MLENFIFHRATFLSHLTSRKYIGDTFCFKMSTASVGVSTVQRVHKFNIHDEISLKSNTKHGVAIRKNEDLGIATISLKNSTIFNGQLLEAVSSLEQWKDGKGLILHAITPYCFPSDALFPHGNDEQLQKFLITLQELTRCIRNLPLISVGFLSGKSSGIITEILLSTDFRLVTPKSELHFNNLKLGLPPLAGGLEFASNIIGPSKTFELFLSNAKVNSAQAIKLGLVDKILSSASPPSLFSSSLGTQKENGLHSTETLANSKKLKWTSKGELNLAENWLENLVGGGGGWGEEKMNEDASIVQALKRILVISLCTSLSSQKCTNQQHKDINGKIRSSNNDQRKLDQQTREILMDCLHGQPHLTAMGLHTEPMFAHLLHSNRQIHQGHCTNIIMGGNAPDDVIL